MSDATELAAVMSINAEISAITIEVAAMQASNIERMSLDKSLAYDEQAFQDKAEAVRDLSVILHKLAYF